MIVNVAYTLVFNTCLYTDACQMWQVGPSAHKSWTNFKIHFAAAHREFRLTNQTAQQSGLNSANMMIEDHQYQGAADTIAQLAVATASDREMVAIITATNAKLTLQLETSQYYVQKLKEDIAQLKLKLKPGWKGQRPSKTMNNDNYCCSHGYQVKNGHTIASCKHKKEGHKTETGKE
jgi:hypothetical protein